MIDVAIVGAGIVGACTAYWLTRLDPSLRVVMVERDRTFARASSALSASSIRQQFSSAINIRMSQFGVQFLREMGIALVERGYLYLGTDAALRELHAVQVANGAEIALLAPREIERRFPWLNVAGVEAGALGVKGEGWFDGPALHAAVLRAARAQGAELLSGQVSSFERDGQRISALVLDDGRSLACRHAVNAGGPWARAIAAAAEIELPVRARRRTVFVLSCPHPLPGCPLVVDPEGFWFRPEGRHFIAGAAPKTEEDDAPLEPDYREFDEALWMRLAHRVSAFEALRVERAWAGYYEMNVFDHNAIIGAHPAVPNLWFANGFSGHGMQQAPAAARGLAELVVHGAFRTLDLSPLGWRRVVERQPLFERNVIG